MSPENFASKGDVDRLETKVDSLATHLFNLTSDVRSVRDAIAARDTLEKQAQVMMAEVSAARAKAAAEKDANEADWNRLKSRALWSCMLLLGVASYPGLISVIKQLKGLVP